MIESDVFVQALQDIGVDFFTGVPDSILGGIIAELMERRLYTPAVREDEAVAMAAGAYMAGKIPAVLMQNSGLGTSLNTLISLNMIYCQPCILIVSWRGYQGKGCARTSGDGRGDAAVSRYHEDSASHLDGKDRD